MLFVSALFATAIYACCSEGMPIVGFILCGMGMTLSWWIGLCRGLSEAESFAQIGRPSFRPQMPIARPGRQEPRYLNEETD